MKNPLTPAFHNSRVNRVANLLRCNVRQDLLGVLHNNLLGFT
jgi:hypothetical protein